MTDEIQNDTQKVTFDEFKLYYESAEKVTDRRLDTNRWNYSICVAILVAIAAIIKWGVLTVELAWIALVAVVLLSFAAILFCDLWVKQIRDLKHLNDAKFAVLNQMAPLIEFDIDHPQAFSSFRPFEREWDHLRESGTARRLRGINIVALSSSNMEYFIPRGFQVVFAGVVIALAVVLATSPAFPQAAPTAVTKRVGAR